MLKISCIIRNREQQKSNCIKMSEFGQFVTLGLLFEASPSQEESKNVWEKKHF